MPTKVHIVKAIVFQQSCTDVSWTIYKAEHQGTDAFELWYWIRLLRVPWTARKSNQSILKEINPEYSLEGLMLKLKLQYLCPPDTKSQLLRQDPDAGQDWRQEEKGMAEDEMIGWHYWFNGHEFEQALEVGDGQGSLAWCRPWCSAFFIVQLSHPYLTNGKTIALTRWTLISKVMFLFLICCLGIQKNPYENINKREYQ